ncbi:KAP family P-loop NTPase fold protein [Cerasicoccus arenae]|uniref:NTPase n=1 Tax=Cerasicoccus arenae TaxID=424488 RepID=A0A8J3DJU6_9BACT|nr:P-loop NTPase fold protein [Cerasicoccus arenae]MBK1857775.1 hypothetical protein [Cerasicoccus arenae]GHC11985.1 NTPase [Cerasicoccus arenae]
MADEATFSQGDYPIQSPDQDGLGRDRFAKGFAARLSRWRGDHSLTIGLCGDWGTGKTSLKNLIVHHLEANNTDIPVVEFNPWMVTGIEAITQTFFGQIASQFPKGDDAKDTARRELWTRYSRYLGFGAKIAEASEVIGVVVPGMAAAGKFSKGALKRAQEMADHAADSLAQPDKSLVDLREEISQSLKDLKAPILIVVDDIDRLTSEEICLIFRLVKANADFPNLMFLMLFQRDTAESALDRLSNGKGRLFLEKIVHSLFDLPQPDFRQVHQALFKRFDEFLAQAANHRFDDERWSNLWFRGFRGYFKTFRHVYRFVSTFEITFFSLIEDSTLDVNQIDLFALECLRVFEPEIYQFLADKRALATGEHDIDTGKEEQKTFVEELLKLRRASDETQLYAILGELFPLLAQSWGGQGYSGGFMMQWRRELRVCVPEHFDRYFRYALSAQEVSEAEIRQILDRTKDRDQFVAEFSKLIEHGRALSALQRLEAESELLTSPHKVEYLLGLSDLCDRFDVGRSIFSENEADYIDQIVRRSTDDANVNERFNLIEKLVTETRSLTFGAHWLQWFDRNKLDDNHPDVENVPQRFDDMEKLWKTRIDDCAANEPERLYNVASLGYVLRYWLNIGDQEKVREFVRSISDPGPILRLLASLVSQRSSQAMSSVYVKNRSYLSWQELEKYASQAYWVGCQSILNEVDAEGKGDPKISQFLKESLERWHRGDADASQPNDD